MSQPSRALYIILNLAKIPYESCPVALRKGEHFGEEFKQVNRFQRVPCIVDKDFKLGESVAIVRYLAKEHKLPDSLYPQDSRKQALVDEYLEWQHLNTRLGCSLYFRLKVLEPLLGKKPEEAVVTMAHKQMVAALKNIENIWLESNRFLVGDGLTVADVFAACEIEQTSRFFERLRLS